MRLAEHKDDRIRSLVAECLGRLYSEYPYEVGDENEVNSLLGSADAYTKIATLARSFMYSGLKI